MLWDTTICGTAIWDAAFIGAADAGTPAFDAAGRPVEELVKELESRLAKSPVPVFAAGAAVSPPVEPPVAAIGMRGRSNDMNIRENNENSRSRLAAGGRGEVNAFCASNPEAPCKRRASS
jgi:hypothetical protein